MFFMSAFAVLVVFRGVWVLSAPSIREDDYAAVRARTVLESGLRCARSGENVNCKTRCAQL